MANEAWNGWLLQTGNTAGTLASSILTCATTATGQGCAYEYAITAFAGDEIELEVMAQAVSGAPAYAYINWVNQGDNTKTGSRLALTPVMDATGMRPYKIKTKVPQQNERATVWFGVGMTYADVGSASFMSPVVRVNGRAVVVPGSAFNGFYFHAFNNAGFTLAQGGTSFMSFGSKAISYNWGGVNVFPNDDTALRALGVHNTAANPGGSFFAAWRNDNGSGVSSFGKTRGAAVGTHVAVQSGDTLWNIRFVGSDGSVFRRGATFNAMVEAAPTGGHLPTYLTLNTSSATTDDVEWLRLKSTGELVHRQNSTIIADANSHLGLRSYTVATLPSAATAARLIYVSDGTTNKRLAVSDGTSWRWPDGAVVS